MPTSTEATLHRPVLGAEGEPCAVCRAPLAPDQRYCLNCGTRRAEARLPFLEVLGREREVVEERVVAPAEPPPPPPRRGLGAFAAGAAGAALLALGLLAGALLTDDEPPAPVQAKAPVVNITNTPPPVAAAATAAPVAFTSDWPAEQEGWTIQLQVLPRESTTPDAVGAAKTAATGAGAPDVGALDSDAFTSLDPGNYVVYSGVFDSRKKARQALAGLEDAFPDAEVVEVANGGGDAEVQSDEDLKRKENLSPEEAQKEIRKAPNKVESEGTPPPTDNEEPGGGSEETVIE